MGSSLLDPSPTAAHLLELAARKATGRIVLGDRTLVLRSGDLAEILPGPDDESLEHFLVQSGKLPKSVLAESAHTAQREHSSTPDVLLARGVLNASELQKVRRSILLDRLTRALRRAAEREGEPPPALHENGRSLPPSGAPGVALLPLLLDALARRAAAEDAPLSGAHLNHRIEWVPGAHTAVARAWADFGDVPQKPAVSTVLAKRPAAAPRLLALVQAGLIRLEAPGRAVASGAPQPTSLPPPPPRPAALDDRVPSGAARAGDPLAAVKPPRLRLDPGFAETSAEPLLPTPLLERSPYDGRADDPLIAIEQRLDELEAAGASGAERARALCALADGWLDRFGSVERASRAFREAAAADPSLPGVLQQAAAHCHQLGQRELAARYVDAAVSAAAMPIERAAAQRLRAAIARSAGDADTCIEALCEAAADDPTSSDAHEQVAGLLLERGQLDGANAHARLAATAVQDDTPDRALALLALGWALKPHDAATAYEYASTLDATGRRAAAVAVLAHAASRVEDPDQRRKLRVAAAERAEAAGRPDIAAELLIDAFDAEPYFDLLYGPLDEDLAALEFVEYRAVALEDVATTCPDEQRAHWLTRAADALRASPGQHESAVWLYYEALLTEPRNLGRLALLREHAESRRELTLLANGLRVAIAAHLEDGRPEARADAERLLRELADLAATGLDNPHLSLAALQQLSRISAPNAELAAEIERFERVIEVRRGQLEMFEQALAQAAPDQRPQLCLRVAGLLPDLPDHWPRAIALLSEALAAGEDVEATRDALETLHGMSRDALALASFLGQQAEACSNRRERVRLLSRLAAVHTVREDLLAVAEVCENLIAVDPGCRIAIARLERAARKLGDMRRLVRALQLRCAIARSERERARALAQLAHAEELAQMYGEAAGHAVDALREDPSAADAALLLLRHIDRVEPELARFGLRVAAAACGPSRALFAAQAQVCHALCDVTGQRAALDTWVELLPNDTAARRTALRFWAEHRNPEALLQAAESALSALPAPEVLQGARDALAVLEELGAWPAATRLALRIAAEQGRPDADLAARALSAARSAGQPALLARAHEQRIATAAREQHAALLLALADVHRELRDGAAEVRALLRVLELDTTREDVLERLRERLTAMGDGPRLVGVLSLLLDRTQDRARRAELHLTAAGVAGGWMGDRARAEFHVRALIAECADDPARVRQALGVLFAIGDADWALSRGQAIAEGCPPELGTRICQFCAATAEHCMKDLHSALHIARTGALRWPAHTELLLVVERLTLALDDADAALEVYGALIAASVGPHSRRALLYRAGRWLERSGRQEEALARYLQAFELAPSGGASFKAVERLSRQTGRPEQVLPCYERLADQADDGRARSALLCAAAELCLRVLADRARAFDLLMRANAATGRFELDERLIALACEWRAEEPDAGRGALLRIAADLNQRAAQAFGADDQARWLLRLARLHAGPLDEPAAARPHVEQALRLEQEEIAEEIWQALTALRDELAEPAVEPVSGSAESARAPALEPKAEPVSEPEAVSDAVSEPAAVSETSGSEHASGSQPEEATAELAPGAGISAEAGQVPERPIAAQNAADERARLRRMLAAEPWQTGALRELHALCAEHGTAAERHVLRQLLAAFDPGIDPVRDPPFHSGLWRGAALIDAMGSDLAPEIDRLLCDLWEYARVIPRLRRTLGSHGVSERDRISRITVGPVAEAYAQAARTLGATDVAVYVTHHNASPPRVLPIHPPAVIAGRGIAEDPGALLYGMAHALWLSHPARMLCGVLDEQDARDLIEGARVAFAPALSRQRAGPAIMELAAALWQSVPTRDQRRVADVLRRMHDELEYTALRGQSRTSAARAALLVSGALAYALRALFGLEPELSQLSGRDTRSTESFSAACRASPAFAETVRCALSEPFLSALAHAL